MKWCYDEKTHFTMIFGIFVVFNQYLDFEIYNTDLWGIKLDTEDYLVKIWTKCIFPLWELRADLGLKTAIGGHR
jgi:hypothetical protein